MTVEISFIFETVRPRLFYCYPRNSMHGNKMHLNKYKVYSQNMATVSQELMTMPDFGPASLLINMVNVPRMFKAISKQ